MEYEIKIYNKLKDIKNYILNQGATLAKHEFQLTYIYDNPKTSIFEGTDGILRVRVTQDKLKNTTEKSVTMKKLASDNNGVKAFDEQTVIIDNEKAMFKLFESLNLSLKELVEKVRVSYLYKGCLFEFDELKRTNRTDIYLEIESPQPAMLNSMLAELKNNNLYE